MYSSLGRTLSSQASIFSLGVPLRQISTSGSRHTSGRFRKMKQATSTFLSRAPAESNTTYDNPVFDPRYLDGLVGKLLQGKSRSRYKFLTRQSPGLLKPDTNNNRENLIQDWNHIDETVTSLGVPEIADVIGGQMFAGGHLRTTTTSCLTLRLADNILHMTDSELKHLIRSIYCWPGDAGGSETLSHVVTKLDIECCRRCEQWETTGDSLPLSLLWARFSFRPGNCLFVSQVLDQVSPSIQEFRLKELMIYFLLVSYSSQIAPSLFVEEEVLRKVEETVLRDFTNLDQTEVALVYSALDLLWSNKEGSPTELKKKVRDTYGFRL